MIVEMSELKSRFQHHCLDIPIKQVYTLKNRTKVLLETYAKPVRMPSLPYLLYPLLIQHSRNGLFVPPLFLQTNNYLLLP